MYNFIFFVIYSQQVEKERGEIFARYNGGLVVAITIMIHLGLIFSIFKKVFSYDDFADFVHSKNFQIPIVITAIALIIFYYSKTRTEKILKKYAQVEYPTSFINYSKVLIAIIVPLVAMIILATK